MSQLGSTTRSLDRHDMARPTGALGFVCLSAYLTIQFGVLGVVEASDFVAAMAVFSVGVLAGATVLHLRLVTAGRFAQGADVDRNSLSTVSLQVLIACTALSSVALLAGRPGDKAPAVAMAITAIVAGVIRVTPAASRFLGSR
ncbi:MAG TPA: hypothetical protein VIG76_10200 [Amnibacterium sp.]|jgi:exosortase/archaeosortase|uniref:hypothetical protein n=1 Tax=Amnibacterium sp. TaxID=1872496 RepID=UPI002F94C855